MLTARNYTESRPFSFLLPLSLSRFSHSLLHSFEVSFFRNNRVQFQITMKLKQFVVLFEPFAASDSLWYGGSRGKTFLKTMAAKTIVLTTTRATTKKRVSKGKKVHNSNNVLKIFNAYAVFFSTKKAFKHDLVWVS